MSTQMTADSIKATREKYGLSQRAFSTLLGIGEATIVRYEKGAVPTKANANLIIAADDPHFMVGCLERNGDGLTPRQRQNAERYIYEFIELEPEDKQENAAAKMNEMYELTLRQEVLNEQAADIVAEIMRYMIRENIPVDCDDPLAILLTQLFTVKANIISVETMDKAKLDQIAGYLRYIQEYVHTVLDKRGAA